MNARSVLRSVLLRESRLARSGAQRAEVRPYHSGDDCRTIDWRASARTGELCVRDARPEPALALATILDISQSMRVGRLRPLIRAAEEVCAFWRQAAFEDGEYVHIPTTNIAIGLATAHARLRRGTAILVVSDAYGIACAESLHGMIVARQRFSCTLLIAQDPWQDGLPLRGFHRFRDIETGRARCMFIGARERARYCNTVRERQSMLLQRVRSAGWRAGLLHEENGVRALFDTISPM